MDPHTAQVVVGFIASSLTILVGVRTIFKGSIKEAVDMATRFTRLEVNQENLGDKVTNVEGSIKRLEEVVIETRTALLKRSE